MSIEKNTVDVIVPADCQYYPGSGRERIIKYQKMQIRINNYCYVVTEAKIYKYDHLLHFARFIIKDNIAILDALESISISYETDTEINPLYRPIFQSELASLIPIDCTDMKVMKHLKQHTNIFSIVDTIQIDDILYNPKNMFNCAFSCPANKKTHIILTVKIDGSGGKLISQNVAMIVDQQDPFGPCETKIIGDIINL